MASLLHGWVPVSSHRPPLGLVAHTPHAALPCDCVLPLPLLSLSLPLSCGTLPAAAACPPLLLQDLSWQEMRGPCPQLCHADAAVGFREVSRVFRCTAAGAAGCAAGPSPAGLRKLAGLLALSSCRLSLAGLDLEGLEFTLPPIRRAKAVA